MKKISIFVGRILLLSGLIALFVVLNNRKQENKFKRDIQIYLYAYGEGQKDAISGDIRIKHYKDSIWVWKKSPINNTNLLVNEQIILDSK